MCIDPTYDRGTLSGGEDKCQIRAKVSYGVAGSLAVSLVAAIAAVLVIITKDLHNKVVLFKALEVLYATLSAAAILGVGYL